LFSNFKLQHILFVTFTLIASLPVVILGYWVQHEALDNEISAVTERHLLVAKNITRDLSRYIIDVENSFKLAIENLVANNKIDGLENHFKTLNIREICVTDNEGYVITKIPSSLIAKNTNSRIDYGIWMHLQGSIKQASHSKKIVISNLLQSKDHLATFYMVTRIDEHKIAIAALSTDYIQKVQKEITFGRRGHAAIVDSAGRIIAHPISSWVSSMKDISSIGPVKKMMNGETGVTKFYTPAMNGDVVAGYTVVPETGWGVMVPQPFEELQERARINQDNTLVVMLIGIAVAGFISWFLSGILVGPIRSVVTATKFSDKDKFINPVKVSTSNLFIPKEVQELLNSFNSMGSKLNSLTRKLYTKIDYADKEVHQQNLKLKDQARELKIINEELERLSTTDNLTNLFNRRLFDEMLESEFSFTIRHNENLSMVMLDLDHFKEINDEYGHIQGDRVLIDVANILKDNFRTSDVIFRIGGEEFAILCRRMNYDESKVMTENLRIALEQHTFVFRNKRIKVTGSFGIVTIPDERIVIDTAETFYRYADKAMYCSKNHGRNRVTHYHDIISETPTKTAEL